MSPSSQGAEWWDQDSNPGLLTTEAVLIPTHPGLGLLRLSRSFPSPLFWFGDVPKAQHGCQGPSSQEMASQVHCPRATFIIFICDSITGIFIRDSITTIQVAKFILFYVTINKILKYVAYIMLNIYVSILFQLECIPMAR